MDVTLDFQEKKNLVDTPAPTHVKSWLRPYPIVFLFYKSRVYIMQSLLSIWQSLAPSIQLPFTTSMVHLRFANSLCCVSFLSLWLWFFLLEIVIVCINVYHFIVIHLMWQCSTRECKYSFLHRILAQFILNCKLCQMLEVILNFYPNPCALLISGVLDPFTSSCNFFFIL